MACSRHSAPARQSRNEKELGNQEVRERGPEFPIPECSQAGSMLRYGKAGVEAQPECRDRRAMQARSMDMSMMEQRSLTGQSWTHSRMKERKRFILSDG